MSLVNILLIVAGVGYILVRRMIGDIVEIKSLLVLPVVLTGVGLLQLSQHGQLDDLGPQGVTTVAFLVVGIALSLGIGAVRGMTVYLAERNGELWMRYRVSTVALWVLNVAVKAAIIPVEVAVTHQSASTATHTLLLSVGLGILAESAVVLVRAMHREGTVVWAKGENGQAHRPSPVFDKARDHVRAGDGAALRQVVFTVERDW